MDPLPSELRSTGGVWAVGIVRDEADIIATVVANLVDQGVERVIVADNQSTDGTGALLAECARQLPVTVLADAMVGYYQAEKTSILARAAARAGAGWVLPFDADEVWVAPGGDVAQWLAQCGGAVVQAPVYNHVPTAHDDASEPDPVRRLRWRKEKPNRLHKVVFRSHPRARLDQGNHGVARRGRRTEGLEVRHFPYRSEEQFIRKLRQGSAAYAATDLSAEMGKHWRGLGVVDDAALHQAWESLVETHNVEGEWWVPRRGVVEDPVTLPPLTSRR
jgi:glycosyltransferase involved in cell wall biosynthesis